MHKMSQKCSTRTPKMRVDVQPIHTRTLEYLRVDVDVRQAYVKRPRRVLGRIPGIVVTTTDSHNLE